MDVVTARKLIPDLPRFCLEEQPEEQPPKDTSDEEEGTNRLLPSAPPLPLIAEEGEGGSDGFRAIRFLRMRRSNQNDLFLSSPTW
jgi:hypothetical protein